MAATAVKVRVMGVRYSPPASLVIGGWVAMWRPMEVFLYDWWPVRAEARLSID
jgi:hypothetical protein